MQAALLSHEHGVRGDYISAEEQENSLGMQLGSAASSPAAWSICSRRRSISAAALYGLIAFACVMTLLCVVFLVSWISARSAEATTAVPAPFASCQITADDSATKCRRRGRQHLPSASASLTSVSPCPVCLSASSSTAPALPALSSSSLSAAENMTDLPNVLTPVVTRYPLTRWPGQVFSYTMLHLLSGLYEVAMSSGGNRAVGQPGFNASVDWLMQQIASKTFLVNVEKTYFTLQSRPSYAELALSAYNSEDRSTTSFAFQTDWIIFLNTAGASNATGATLVLIANQGGCNESDWQDLYPAPDFFFALVPRTSDCADSVRIGFAQLYGAAAIMLQSSNVTKSPVIGVAPASTKIAVISVSYAAGQALADAVLFGGTSAVSVFANIRVVPGPQQVVTNMSALQQHRAASRSRHCAVR